MSTGFTGPIVHGTRSNQASYAYRNGMGMMPSAEFDVFHDDFHSFVVATAITNGPVANTPWGWQGAIIDSGATVAVNTTATIGANGVLTFADATASEGAAIYGTKSFQLITGKKAFIEVRVRTDDVTDNAIQFGLSDLTATTNPEDLWTTTAANVLAFGLLDGSATPTLLADEGNAGTAAVAGTIAMVANTWTTLAIFYDGLTAHAFVNGKKSLSTAVTVPEAVALAPFFGHINGNGAGGNVVLLDYFRVVSQR